MRTECLPMLPFGGMAKYRGPDPEMLIGGGEEDCGGGRQGSGCVAVPLHMSEDDQSEGRMPPRHPANGRLVMDVRRHQNCQKAIRCTVPSCTCDCFTPGKTQIRTCDTCKHGWVAHALDKLGFRHLYNCNQVEIVQPNIVFDIASLILYGCQATPIRLKILLDRLFSVLQHEEVLQVLHGFGWGYEDYARGYILQDNQGNVLDKWTVSTRDEEPFILQQFLRFGETKAITQHILLQESSERPDYAVQQQRTDSDIKRFIERTNRVTNPFYRQGDGYPVTKPLHPLQQPPLQQQQQQPPAPPQPPPSAVPDGKPLVRLPSTGGSSVPNLSPTGSSRSFGSPVNCTSPLSISPLNRLQNMQPYDYRRDRSSPEIRPKTEPSPFQLQGGALPQQRPSPPVLPTQRPSAVVACPAAAVAALSSLPCTSPTPVAALPTVLGSSIIHSSNSSLLANSDLSASDGISEDDLSGMALNLSRSASATAAADSIYATKKVKHLRKSANPMKRRWNPNVLGALVSNSNQGKKRVQCTVCLKTFCDKGALKIHFSAVHLKEMHKCTVEGCNMMFSSRRSRNRHSANPNPKLHSPHLRRKISPHDGRTASAHPGFYIGAGLLPPPLGPLKIEGDHHHHGGGGHHHHHHHHHHHLSSIIPTPPPLPLALPLRSASRTPSPVTPCGDVEEGQPVALHPPPLPRRPDETEEEDAGGDPAPMELKRARLSEADADDGSGPDGKEGEPFANNRGVRKRKSLNPTRCTVAADVDGIEYVSSDDSSSDTFLQNDSIDNGTEKSEDFKDDEKTEEEEELDDDDKDLDDDDDDDIDDDDDDIKTSLTPFIPADRIKKEKPDDANRLGGGGGGARRESPKDPATCGGGGEENSEMALRRLESLSQGFGAIYVGDASARSGKHRSRGFVANE